MPPKKFQKEEIVVPVEALADEPILKVSRAVAKRLDNPEASANRRVRSIAQLENWARVMEANAKKKVDRVAAEDSARQAKEEEVAAGLRAGRLVRVAVKAARPRSDKAPRSHKKKAEVVVEESSSEGEYSSSSEEEEVVVPRRAPRKSKAVVEDSMSELSEMPSDVDKIKSKRVMVPRPVKAKLQQIKAINQQMASISNDPHGYKSIFASVWK